MDQRHYTSMLLLVGIVAIAWVLAKVQPKEGGASVAEHSPLLLQTGAITPQTSGLDAKDVESLTRTATPLIPGLLDDDPSAEFQLADGRKLSTRSSPLPLRTISNEALEQVDNTITDTHEKQELVADESTPRVRSLPTFSMPNTQNPILNRQRNLGGDKTELNPIEQTGNPRPLGTVSSLQEPGNQTSSTQLQPDNSENQEPSYRPLVLPNNRHVLRPIIRSQPRDSGGSVSTQQTLPNQAGVASAPRSEATQSNTPSPSTLRSKMVESEVTGTADWEAPMPGVRVRSETERDIGRSAPNGQESNRQKTLQPNSRFVPFASSDPSSTLAATESSDPLFAVAVQDLYRLPGEDRANVAVVSPTTNVTAAGHSTSPSTRANTPLRPRTTQTRPGGRPASDYIWHVIQPNQSLEAISFQYFGDEGGIARLIEFNNDVFDNPKLLPVGKAIRIPLR